VDGKPAADGEVQWTLTQDGVEPKRSGKAKLVEGRATVTGTLDAPGFLQCRVNGQVGETKLTALGGGGLAAVTFGASLRKGRAHRRISAVFGFSGQHARRIAKI